MGNSDNLFEILDTESLHRLAIVRQDRLKRLDFAPLRMLRRQCNDLVDGEGYLCVDRLLNPEGAVVVERCDSLVQLDKIRRTLLCYALDKIDDRFLWCRFIPRWQGILRANNGGNAERYCCRERDEFRFH